MTRSIAIRRNQHCWGSLNEEHTPPQQHPYGNGYSRYAGRISAIFVVGVVSRVRGVSGINALNHGRHTPILFQSALAPRADADALSGLLLLPLLGRRFEFFPALKVAGDLLSIGFHRTLTVCQDATSEFANVLHFLALSAGFTGLVSTCDGHISTEGKSTCPTKEFPKSEKIFPGLT